MAGPLNDQKFLTSQKTMNMTVSDVVNVSIRGILN